MNVSIYMSYRRADAAFASSAVHDRLAAHFGRERVLLDVESVQPGADFVQTLSQTVKQSTVCLVIIGDKWLSVRDRSGTRRIDDPQDFVRFEIETAFAQGIPVIPVLVGGARMPSPMELPESLQRLTQFNTVELRTGRDFSGNIERLIQAIDHFVTSPGRKDSVLLNDIRSESPLHDVEPTKGPLPAGHVAGSVFISYRREGGAETARLLRYELIARGWRVFLDVEDLKAGTFDEILLAEVADADNFILILSPGALANCVHDNDWLRQEIGRAIETKRNIVPILKENARRPDKEELPSVIEPLKRLNCIDYSHIYYDATIGRLFSFLKPGEV